MMESIIIKLLEPIKGLFKNKRRLAISLGVFGLLSFVLTVIIHELGHMMAAHLLGYEYTAIPEFGDEGIGVTIINLNHNSLDPFIIGSSGGYLVTAVLAPWVYLFSKMSGKRYFTYDARLLFSTTYVTLATLMITHFVYGTLEGVAFQTDFLSLKTAGVVGVIVGCICFVIMCIHEYVDTEKVLQKWEDLKHIRILE